MSQQGTWKVKTLRPVGKKGATVQGTFRHDINPEDLDIKAKGDPVDEIMSNLITLEQVLYLELKKEFCFKISITTYSSPKGISEVVYFDIERKRDFEAFGEGFDGHYVKMLGKAHELQQYLAKEKKEEIEWIYILKSDEVFFFSPRDFTFKNLVKKGERTFHEPTPRFVIIPTQAKLRSLLHSSNSKSEIILLDEFNDWKIKNNVRDSLHYYSPCANFLKFFMHYRFDKSWDPHDERWISGPMFFTINDKLTLKLERGTTNIYVDDVPFEQCKYLLLNIPKTQVQKFDEINSIDEAIEIYDRSLENDRAKHEITPEEEFQGHCSNLQAWAENNYDTRLLHSNLAFPLLKKLSEAGDPIAKSRFKDEIAERIESGHTPVIAYLFQEAYLHEFTRNELAIIAENTKSPFHKIFLKLFSWNYYKRSAYSIQFVSLGNLPEINLFHDRKHYPRVRIYQDTEFYELSQKGRIKIKRGSKSYSTYNLGKEFPEYTFVESFGKRYYYFFENGQLIMEQCVKLILKVVENKEEWIVYVPKKKTGFFFLNKTLGMIISVRSYKLKVEMLVADAINISWLFESKSIKYLSYPLKEITKEITDNSLFKQKPPFQRKFKEIELTQRLLTEF